jgi:hypothetical protein
MGLAAQLIRPYSRIQRAQLAARLFPQSISLGRSVGAANLITGSVGIFHNQRSLAPHVRAVSIKALDVRFGSKADILAVSRNVRSSPKSGHC